MHGLPENVYYKVKEVINKFSKYQFKLFGSRARGNYHASSDIDIAVFGEAIGQDEFLIKNEFDKIDTAYKIDVVVVKENTKKSLVESIMREGVEF